MPYRLLTTLLIVAVVSLASPHAATAKSKADRADADSVSLADRIKDGVHQLGTGPDARISVHRQDGKKVKGYVAAADEVGFLVVTKSGETTQIPYGDVTQVKGHNIATGWKIAIGAGIGAGIVLLVLFIYIATHE